MMLSELNLEDITQKLQGTMCLLDALRVSESQGDHLYQADAFQLLSSTLFEVITEVRAVVYK